MSFMLDDVKLAELSDISIWMKDCDILGGKTYSCSKHTQPQIYVPSEKSGKRRSPHSAYTMVNFTEFLDSTTPPSLPSPPVPSPPLPLEVGPVKSS